MRLIVLVLLGTALASTGCVSYLGKHEIQWNSRSQIWRAEASQVKVRSAQSRVFDMSDRLQALEAVVATFQDLGFKVEVLDEVLGVVSGKKFVDLERPTIDTSPDYLLYDTEDLLAFSKSFRSWGPFWHRSDLVRLTVTVRHRNDEQLIVRAASQFYLRPIEDPGPYQKFFRTLESALFLERERSVASGTPLP